MISLVRFVIRTTKEIAKRRTERKNEEEEEEAHSHEFICYTHKVVREKENAKRMILVFTLWFHTHTYRYNVGSKFRVIFHSITSKD